MAKPLKVFGSTPIGRDYVPESLSPHRQTRHIVAAPSRVAACRLMGSRSDFTSETGNQDEIRVALESPGTVFWQTHRWNKVFEPVPTRRTEEG